MDCIEPKTPFRPPKNRRGAKGEAQQVEEFLSFFGNDPLHQDSSPSPVMTKVQQTIIQEESPMLEHEICRWLATRGVTRSSPEDNKHRYYDHKRRDIGSKISATPGSETRDGSTLESVRMVRRIGNMHSCLATRRAFGEDTLLDLCTVSNFQEKSPKLCKSTSTAEEKIRISDRLSRNRPTLGSSFSMEETLTLVNEN